MTLTLAAEIVNVEADLEQLRQYISGEKRLPKRLTMEGIKEQHAIESAYLTVLRAAEAPKNCMQKVHSIRTGQPLTEYGLEIAAAVYTAEAEGQDVMIAQVLRMACDTHNAEVAAAEVKRQEGELG